MVALYSLFALVALLNWVLMTRPRRRSGQQEIVVLIPARNEAENLRRLLPALLEPNPALEVIVYDDESDDGTAKIAEELGARVVTATPLPPGWSGKNWACHQLALAAESTSAPWLLFLDADVRPVPGFLEAMNALCRDVPSEIGMVTGFPQVLPGRGVEPLFLDWVGWILLVSNPYGVVSRTRLGHNRFKNGQVHCWRREVYRGLRPNEQVKDKIMEDVEIGRLLARKGIPVEVANLSSVLQVRMYDTWKEALDGMSKNSFEITGTVWGSGLVAVFFLLLGWGWLLAGPWVWPAIGLLALSGFFVSRIARTPLWPMLLMPVVLTIGALTVMRSTVWHQRGTVKWKGRVYGTGATRQP